MKLEMWVRSRASAPMIASESPASWARTLFWRPSTASTSFVSRRAGLARSMISASSSPRAAKPAPRSLRMSRKRSG